ncbi:MAG: peptide deformylase [Methylophagaceae bacterium]
MTNNSFTIRQLGDPVLRNIAETVTDITDSHTQSFLDDLLQFVLDKKGMGIAAPQVGISQRIFIMSSRPNSRYPSAPEMEPTFVINPEIIRPSTETEKDWEGCLSIPGVRALVPRHTAIKVQYTSRTGEIIEAEYSGFLARVFQHELDHLDGKVFLDHVEDSHDIMMEQEWLKLFS